MEGFGYLHIRKLNMAGYPRILVCPLDWGLGHAVRCIPIIRLIRQYGAVPVIAADAGPLELLQKEFPDAEFVRFPGATVTYPQTGQSMVWNMLRQGPNLLRHIEREKHFIQKTVPELRIQGVISDNRFGAFSRRVPSAYITHQVHIQTGNRVTDALARMQHASYMKHFTHVWIPDVEAGDNLSGKLSHGRHIPGQARYIGPLSRFSAMPPAEEPAYDVAMILSGPEPQRTILEMKLVAQTYRFPRKKFLLIRGKREALPNLPGHITQIPLAGHADILMAYARSEQVVCRSGYTGIMEMAGIGRSACLVPTPGQTEQEYLARYVNGRFGFTYRHQDELRLDDLSMALPEAPPVFRDTAQGMADALQAFIAEIR